MEATPSPTPMADAPALATSARSMGATLGAVLGLAATAGLYMLSAVPELEAVFRVRYILGPDGAAAALGSTNPAWVVAPLAASVAGWSNAPRAVGRQRWAGVRMGFMTYGVAIAIAPIALYAIPSLTMFAPSDLVELVEGASAVAVMCVVLPLIAGVMLAPLLLVCAPAGALWAAVLRSVMGPSMSPGDPSAPAAARGTTLVVIAAALGFIWLAGAWFLGGELFGGGQFID